MKRVLGDGRHGALLDYSGGTGLVSLELAGYFDSALIADASEKMVKVAEAKISRSGLENFEALHLDLTKGNSDLKADVILVSLVLLHVPGTAGLLEQLYNTLDEHGKLIIPKVHNGFTHEEMEEKLKIAGFESVFVHTFHHGKEIFMKKDTSMFLAEAVKQGV